MTIKFRWFPKDEASEVEFLAQMKEKVTIGKEVTEKLQKDLMNNAMQLGEKGVKGKVSELITSRIIPTLENYKLEIEFSKPKAIKDAQGKTFLYSCGFNVKPLILEYSVDAVARNLGAGKFMSILGFNYGKVEFYK